MGIASRYGPDKDGGSTVGHQAQWSRPPTDGATVPGGAAVRSGVHAAPQRASRSENRKLTAGMPR